MKGNLVIVESPTKARKIQGYLGSDYIVKSSQGHIRDLQENNLSIDIEGGFVPQYVIPSGKAKIVSDLKKAAAEASTVFLASDEDREGEAIAWHLSEVLSLDPAKTKRIGFHEITKPAILAAIESPRAIDRNLVDAQQARRVLDRLVGFELSPVLWKKIQPKLSAGRVQSVALRLVVDREREIMAFRSEPYYKVDAVFHTEGFPLPLKATLGRHLTTKDEAYALLEKFIGERWAVAAVSSKEGTRTPAAPFTTSSLQQEAVRKLGMSVNQTMQIAQKLYEEGLITYMRTDSVNLSSLAINTAKSLICDNFGPEYSRPRNYKTKIKGAQEAHEAIRPTYIQNPEINGTPAEKKLYSLIWKRTVASQMSDAKVLGTTIDIKGSSCGETFRSEGCRILFDGFLKLYHDGEDTDIAGENNTSLPDIQTGTPVFADSIGASAKFTSAPARYTQGTLIKKLEEMQIGRPATWATIISTLIKGRGYIVEGDKEGITHEVTCLSLKDGRIKTSVKKEVVGAEKHKLLPQDIGMMVTDYLVEHFEKVMDYSFTASVEEDLDRIAEGKMAWSGVIGNFYSPFHTRVCDSMSDSGYSRLERRLGVDPSDGKPIVAKFGQYGPYVQKGEGDDKTFASLSKGQLIESISLEEALKLFELPRTLGEVDGIPVIVTKGRYGAYIKYGSSNVSLPRGADPMKITLENASTLIAEASRKSAAKIISQWGDIQIIDGSFGPYIKASGSNYKIPKDVNAYELKEEDVKNIINSSSPTRRKARYFNKK